MNRCTVRGERSASEVPRGRDPVEEEPEPRGDGRARTARRQYSFFPKDGSLARHAPPTNPERTVRARGPRGEEEQPAGGDRSRREIEGTTKGGRPASEERGGEIDGGRSTNRSIVIEDIVSRGSFRSDPSKRRNWKLSNRTERQSRSAGARGEEESSTRARLLITGTAPERRETKSRRGIRKKAAQKRRGTRRDAAPSLERGVLPFGC